MERLQPLAPTSHGKPLVDDHRVLNRIIFVNRDGMRWRDVPGNTVHTRRSKTAGSVGATWAFLCG
jgi:transposase